MKKFAILAILAVAMSANAFADESTSTTTAQQQQQQQAASTANNQIGCLINCADTTNSTKALADSTVQAAAIAAQAARDVAATTVTVKNTPSVSGPNLTSSNDTCMGSTSGSVNIAGLGIGAGTSWVDNNCKMLKNSRELWNMGMKAASLALMCTDSANREALELTGFTCPQSVKSNKQATTVETGKPVAANDTTYTGNDPIIRARMGLSDTVAAR